MLYGPVDARVRTRALAQERKMRSYIKAWAKVDQKTGNYSFSDDDPGGGFLVYIKYPTHDELLLAFSQELDKLKAWQDGTCPEPSTMRGNFFLGLYAEHPLN